MQEISTVLIVSFHSILLFNSILSFDSIQLIYLFRQGTYCKIKIVNTKLLIQTIANNTNTFSTYSETAAPLSFPKCSALVASSLILWKVISLFQRYVRHLKTYSILIVKKASCLEYFGQKFPVNGKTARKRTYSFPVAEQL